MKRDSKFNRSEGDGGDESGANWQDSYSDLMTDLLAIFVVLFSFAMMSQAIAASNAADGQNTVTAAAETAILPAQESILSAQDGILPDQDSFNSLFESIKSYIEEAGLSKQLSVTKQGDNQILLRVAASAFFDSGRADINSNAKLLLSRISKILTEYADSIKMVRIEGHTDNRPINTKQYDSNWELSTSRAVNVLRRLLEISKLEPEKFSAVGYSEFYPIADNDTAAGRAKNRRVDFFFESVSD